MPPPRILEISRTIAVMDEEDNQLVKLQRLIENFSERNRQYLTAAGNRQAEQTRKKIAKKIKVSDPSDFIYNWSFVKLSLKSVK